MLFLEAHDMIWRSSRGGRLTIVGINQIVVQERFIVMQIAQRLALMYIRHDSKFSAYSSKIDSSSPKERDPVEAQPRKC